MSGTYLEHEGVPIELDEDVDASLLEADPDDKDSGLDLEKVHAHELAEAEEVEA